jgi:hypothetical protein
MASIFELEQPSFGRASEGKVLVAASNTAGTQLTAAQSVGAVITATPTGGRTITTATLADIKAELGAQFKVGQTFELHIVNLATETHALTLSGGSESGVTVSGVAAVAAASSGTFVGRINSATAIVFYRV